jgi:hypothetical protein
MPKKGISKIHSTKLEALDVKILNQITSRANKLFEKIKESDNHYNNEDIIRSGVYLYNFGFPILPNYCNKKGIHAIDILFRIFKEKKDVLKYIEHVEKCNDIGSFERYLDDKNLRELVKLLKTRTFKFLDAFSRSKYSFHNFCSNLPKVNPQDDPDEIASFLSKLLKYNFENVLEILPYMNYKKVRFAKNLGIATKHIKVVKAARSGFKSGSEKPAFMELQKIKSDLQVNFTKEPAIVSTIGNDTGCCFRHGGVAQSLLKPALESPISGILEGRLNHIRWFSFVWEIVEMDEGIPCKSLVLDNVEAKSRIEDGGELWARLKKLRGYRKIYCGYMRNDIIFEEGITDKKKPKPYSLAGYEGSFDRYGSYDDSRELYTLCEQEIDNNVNIHLMNPGDLHRCKYIEKKLYSVPDGEFLDIKINKSPSFIWESKTCIYGYLTTEIKYYQTVESSLYDYPNRKTINGKDYYKVKRKEKEGEYLEVLFINDIFLMNYKSIKRSLSEVINVLDDFCKQKGIKIISASFNKFSKPFLKRIKDLGYYFIDDDMAQNESFPTMFPLKEEFIPSSVSFITDDILNNFVELEENTAEE